MPVTSAIDHESRFLLGRGSGVLTGGELAEAVGDIRESEDFDPTYNEVWDFRNQTRVEVSASEVRSLASLISRPKYPRPECCLRAILVPNDLEFGLARMFEMLVSAKSPGFVAFRRYEDARDWFASAGVQAPESVCCSEPDQA